ncbi:hypothetical protein [Roseibium album]|uniref:Uncharacterized protein n=1 Tax=Roseibium album TaxID=311410 RepID=A0A0M6ZTQ7_9HYPH|nr:hypothetical protein [Roseibium album]CTQ58149.1 hypothetical protein LA5094_00906 [Roseibium album]CTQ65687.1 hypothetical protein LA5096_00817 [Roseibium album]CTQ70568.1 hypothetical protein LA5095_01961 [Roseibium album]
MVVFEDVEDVIEWLESLGYVDFWEAVEPYQLTLQDRDFCDGQIASGSVPQNLVLSGLKTLARIELTQRLKLKRRCPEPTVAQYLRLHH